MLVARDRIGTRCKFRVDVARVLKRKEKKKKEKKKEKKRKNIALQVAASDSK